MTEPDSAATTTGIHATDLHEARLITLKLLSTLGTRLVAAGAHGARWRPSQQVSRPTTQGSARAARVVIDPTPVADTEARGSVLLVAVTTVTACPPRRVAGAITPGTRVHNGQVPPRTARRTPPINERGPPLDAATIGPRMEVQRPDASRVGPPIDQENGRSVRAAPQRPARA